MIDLFHWSTEIIWAGSQMLFHISEILHHMFSTSNLIGSFSVIIMNTLILVVDFSLLIHHEWLINDSWGWYVEFFEPPFSYRFKDSHQDGPNMAVYKIKRIVSVIVEFNFWWMVTSISSSNSMPSYTFCVILAYKILTSDDHPNRNVLVVQTNPISEVTRSNLNNHSGSYICAFQLSL